MFLTAFPKTLPPRYKFEPCVAKFTFCQKQSLMFHVYFLLVRLTSSRIVDINKLRLAFINALICVWIVIFGAFVYALANQLMKADLQNTHSNDRGQLTSAVYNRSSPYSAAIFTSFWTSPGRFLVASSATESAPPTYEFL